MFQLRDREKGQSLVELALLLPLLLLIMAGVLDLGRAFYAYTTVINAAREGARYASLYPTDSIGIQNQVVQEAAGSGIDLSSATVTIEPEGGQIAPGVPIRVTVVYQFQPITGLIFGGQSISIRGSVSMAQF